jgi:pimeloyl-ACP methyl ester carboxylesterase
MTRRLLIDDDLHSDSDRRMYRCVQWIHGRLAGDGQLERRGLWSIRVRRRGLIACVAVFLWTGFLPGSAPARTADQSIVELPVSFQVSNTNTSKVPCFSDGATYTVKGHITAPQGALSTGRADTITVYLYGYEGGEWNWHLKSVPGYDYAAEMAKLGHVSLTVDELGYGASGRPQDGNLTCQGAEADITHQIIEKLRSPDYVLGTGRGVAFSKVVLAGHDVGGQVAEIEAYSYSDIDGLLLVTFADQGFTPFIIERATVAATDWCTVSPTGYVHYVSDEEWRTLLFHDADPRVIDATAALRNPNPCGIIRSVPTAVEFDAAHDAEIQVPVLVVFGDNDTVCCWSREGEEQQQDNFGSSDKSTVFIPNAGHFIMFEKTAPLLRSAVSSWLDSRFPSQPAGG